MARKLTPQEIKSLSLGIAMALYALTQFLPESIQRGLMWTVAIFILFCIVSDPIFKKLAKNKNKTPPTDS